MANRKQISLLAIMIFIAALVSNVSVQASETEENVLHHREDPKVIQNGVNIYLLADETVDLKTAISMPLSEVVLRDEPWIASEDIELYDFSSHCIYLKKERPLPFESVSLRGNPFVVTADGQRCYLGSLWTPISSFLPERTIPLIDIPDFTLPPDVIKIDLLSIVSSSDIGLQLDDVRNDSRIIQALIQNGQYHAGLEIILDNVTVLHRDDGSSLKYTYTLINKDEDNLYVFDPNKMGAGLFHYFNNCPSLLPKSGQRSVAVDTSKIVKRPEPWGKIETSWFSLIKGGESMTRTITLDGYSEIPPGKYVSPGKYECSFYFNSPGARFSKDQRAQFYNRVWMGEIGAKLNFEVNAGKADADESARQILPAITESNTLANIEEDLELQKFFENIKETDRELNEKWDLPEDVLGTTSTDKLFLHFIRSPMVSMMEIHNRLETGVQRLLNSSVTLHEFYMRPDMVEGALKMYSEYDLSPESMSDEQIKEKFSATIDNFETKRLMEPNNIVNLKIAVITLDIMHADMILQSPQFFPKLKGHEREFLNVFLERYEKIAELQKKYGHDFGAALGCGAFCVRLAESFDEKLYSKLKAADPSEAGNKLFYEELKNYLNN